MALFYGQIVIGPAGSGKSTYCSQVQNMGQLLKRNIMVINLDPAAEYFKYKCDVDIRDLITLEDVMQEMQLGPNGGLVYCLEYLLQNLDWFQSELNQFGNDDYVLFDCPGQIELYTHLDLMSKITSMLTNIGFSLATVYMLDVNFISDDSKYISGLLMAQAASMTMEVPHFTILTKCDLVEDKKRLKKYLKLNKFAETASFQDDDEENVEIGQFEKTYGGLTKCTYNLVSSYGGLRLLSMDVSDEESVQRILQEIDYAIQYGENCEPDDRAYDKVEEDLLKGQFQQIDLNQ